MSLPEPQLSASKDRVVRVFVSSTFRDMVEDRNELMAQVWPALRKLCRGRGVEFVEVDLRWGVTEEQSQRKETLRHCLAEIKRCRPYFIGLLGERYGWTPGIEAYSQALLDEEGWLQNEVAKHSVTELEILHGVLRDPEMAGRAFFYFRDPKYSEAVTGDRKPDFAAENAESADKQKHLKELIRQTCRAKKIPLRENYADPRVLAALVLADLTAAINAEFPPDQVPDVWSREDRDHEAYAKSRRTDIYVGRDAYFDRLDAFARDGADGCGLTVLGESGSGKSALLSNWVARWRHANSGDFVFQHYIGSSPMSAGHLALMRRLMVTIVRWCSEDGGQRGLGAEEDKIPAQAEEIVKIFPDYLNRLAARARQKGVRAVLVLDALNQLEDRERGRLLAWLPYRLPGDLRLIVSILPGDTFNALQPRGWPALTVEPLATEERVRLIARYLAHFSQGLSNDRARKIAGVAAASTPLYLKTLLDDLRATGAHDRLDAQIEDYLKAVDIPALFGKILARYERDYERDRPSLVREALSLLWVARRGLTEPELLAALKPAGQDRLPAAVWSPVRCALEDGLVDRDGVLAFAHDHLRTAVERRYELNTGTARALRLRLADDFAGRCVDARQADELPWLLRQAEARDRLRACLLDIDRFLLMQDRDEYELMAYWVWLGEERTMCDAYVQAVERWAGDASRERLHMAAGVHAVAGFLLMGDFVASAEGLFRKALLLARDNTDQDADFISQCRRDLATAIPIQQRHAEIEALIRETIKDDEARLGPNHPMIARDLRVLGQVLGDEKAGGRLREAHQAFTRALKIDERHYGLDHDKVGTDLTFLALMLADSAKDKEDMLRRVLAITEKQYGEHHVELVKPLNNLAHVLSATGRLNEAGPLRNRALAIAELFYPPHSTDLAFILNNQARYLQYTNRLPEAIAMMRRAIAIFETAPAFRTRVVNCLNNLAQMLMQTGDLREAQAVLERAIAIGSGAPGGDLDVARSLNNLSKVKRSRWRLAEATALSIRAVKIYDAHKLATGYEHERAEEARFNFQTCRFASACLTFIWTVIMVGIIWLFMKKTM